ncbi:MAG: hypothetical protein GVY08_15265 [Bacteroidetes bacterium]|nr:hypothetical protein [Bacteroidota bacterium]
MNKILCGCLLLLFIFLPIHTAGQATVEGTITSMNGEPVPNVVVSTNLRSQATIFNQIRDIVPDKNGHYHVHLEEAGIYTITIHAVFHKPAVLRMIVFDQGPVEMDIRLIPRRYNDGRHFDKRAYTDWIRAYGNFNGYDYFSGQIFESNPDGSIKTTIPAGMDTVRYQVRGITSRPGPLPGEIHTEIRVDNTFEGVILPPAGADSLQLRYDPSQADVFPRNIPGAITSRDIDLRYYNALLSFKNPENFYWFKPLYLVNRAHVPVALLRRDEPPESARSSKIFDPLYGMSRYSAAAAYRQRINVKKTVQTKTLHEQQRSALYIAYLGLLAQEARWNRIRTQPEHQLEQDSAPTVEFLKEITEQVPPRHPMWALNPDAAVQLLTFSHFDREIVRYTERMVRQHEDDMVVRNLVLKLISESADAFDHYEDMPEYRWIVQRYGENNLARKAIVAFVKAQRNN